MSVSASELSAPAGTARLPVVVPVAVVSFFYASILDYVLPLFFGALSAESVARGQDQQADIWSELWSRLQMYQAAPWIVGPVLAGLLARKYGECVVCSAALIGTVLVPLTLALYPDPVMIYVLAL